jgi:tRNA uridine 5-carboxymethylaminomethyl modification enzyme
MFTSRAEYRILLRQDNADLRLTPLAHRLGVRGTDIRMDRVRQKEAISGEILKFLQSYSVGPEQINDLLERLESSPIRQKVKLDSILSRPNLSLTDLKEILPELQAFLQPFDPEFVDLAEINLKYEGYIRKEQEMVDKMNRLEELRLHDQFDYRQIEALSKEAREKLSRLRPRTIGQASRISGISPADISILLVHIGR